jgi:hypothetical protein
VPPGRRNSALMLEDTVLMQGAPRVASAIQVMQSTIWALASAGEASKSNRRTCNQGASESKEQGLTVMIQPPWTFCC